MKTLALFKNKYAWLGIGVLIMITAFVLHGQGRLWICSCNEIYFWVGNPWSADNSQHIFDPYSFSHFQHGMVFLALLRWVFKKVSLMHLLVVAVVLECAWEMLENSSFIIDRYREGTAALGYNGDTVLNSVVDIICCIIGFMVTAFFNRWIGMGLFIFIEVVMIWWIKDSFILNVLMLVYPIQAIKNWQMP